MGKMHHIDGGMGAPEGQARESPSRPFGSSRPWRPARSTGHAPLTRALLPHPAGRTLTLDVTCKVPTRREQLAKRHKRVRNTVEGTPERPRLAVFRSNNHMYAQVIDDVSQSTLVMTSTLNKELKASLNGVTNNAEAAAAVGRAVAEMCKEKKIEQVCFDRGGFQYHGRVKALAEAAREGGLSF